MRYIPFLKPIAFYLMFFFLLQGTAAAAGGAQEEEEKKGGLRNALLRKQQATTPVFTGILQLDKHLLSESYPLPTAAPAADDLEVIAVISYISGLVGFVMFLISIAAYGVKDGIASAPGVISLILLGIGGAGSCIAW